MKWKRHGSMDILVVWVVLCSLTRSFVNGQNAIVGAFDINCIKDHIELSFNTKKIFKGRVFVKDAPDPKCSYSFSKNRFSEAAVSLPLDACNTKSGGSAKGYVQSAMVVITFHPIFLTNIDVAVLIECLQPEGTRNVTQRLEVGSAMNATTVTVEMPKPQVSYSLHLDKGNGPEIFFAMVGQTVVHKWQTTAAEYGIVVHSCKAMTPGEKPVDILDPQGCALDTSIFPQPKYDAKGQTVTADTKAFKFMNSEDITFMCKVDFCLLIKAACRKRIPPDCRKSKGKRPRRETPEWTSEVHSTKLVLTESITSPTNIRTHNAYSPIVTMWLIGGLGMGLMFAGALIKWCLCDWSTKLELPYH